MQLQPRVRHVPLGPSRADLAPPAPSSSYLAEMPREIAAHIGRIQEAILPKQGVCNLSWFLRSQLGTFVLKVAQGDYRGAELRAEHTAMLDLAGTAVPVPRTLGFATSGPLSFQVRERAAGEEARTVMGRGDRVPMLRAMGATLGEIHRVNLPCWPGSKRTAPPRAGSACCTGTTAPRTSW